MHPSMHPRRTLSRRRPGFSLIEMLIVVVILGVLAAIVTQLFGASAADAGANVARAQLATVRRQIEVYRMRWDGELPPASAGIEGLWTALCSDTVEHRALLTRSPGLPEHFSWIWNGERLGLRYSGQDPALEGQAGGW